MGKFLTDSQTLEDLNLLGKFKQQSIFSIFNKVNTLGGERLLQEMFRNPFTEPEAINQRSKLFRFFQESGLKFPVSSGLVEKFEQYLSHPANESLISSFFSLGLDKMKMAVLKDENYLQITGGLEAAIMLLNAYRTFLAKIPEGSPYQHQADRARSIMLHPQVMKILETKNIAEASLSTLARYDYSIKTQMRQQMEDLLSALSDLDVYTTVASVATEKGFGYAKALPATPVQFSVDGLRHPNLPKGVTNSLSFSAQNNLLFLTGANMAGKSTLMKSFGISVYLAHMGFPVAAEQLSFSVQEGLFSSINVRDNLQMGHSHFYAEVLRVKMVAEQIASGKNLLVLFDELFKGTNVKDAFDGTLAVSQAFSRYKNSFFIISTHIIEVGESLMETAEGSRYAYLPTIFNGNVPEYTYKLKKGITSDRQGMMIIENEGIIDILTNKG